MECLPHGPQRLPPCRRHACLGGRRCCCLRLLAAAGRQLAAHIHAKAATQRSDADALADGRIMVGHIAERAPCRLFARRHLAALDAAAGIAGAKQDRQLRAAGWGAAWKHCVVAIMGREWRERLKEQERRAREAMVVHACMVRCAWCACGRSVMHVATSIQLYTPKPVQCALPGPTHRSPCLQPPCEPRSAEHCSSCVRPAARRAECLPTPPAPSCGNRKMLGWVCIA